MLEATHLGHEDVQAAYVALPIDTATMLHIGEALGTLAIPPGIFLPHPRPHVTLVYFGRLYDVDLREILATVRHAAAHLPPAFIDFSPEDATLRGSDLVVPCTLPPEILDFRDRLLREYAGCRMVDTVVRPYVPHATLGRWLPGADPKWSDVTLTVPPATPDTIVVNFKHGTSRLATFYGLRG